MRTPIARHWPLLLPYALLLAVFHAWFVPGLIAGEDFQTPSFAAFATIAHSGFWPPSFDPLYDFGKNLEPWWPSFPIWALVGTLFRSGVPWTVLERLFWFWPYFALAVAMPYLFFVRRGVAPAAAAGAAALFAVNTWTLALVERGHIPALVSYALMPIVLDRFLTLLDKRDTRTAVVLALLVTLQAVYEPRYAYLTVLVCIAILAVALTRLGRLRRPLGPLAKCIALSAGLAVVLNAYWWLALAFAPVSLPDLTSVAEFLLVSQLIAPAYAFAFFFPEYHHNTFVAPFVVEPIEIPFLIVPLAAVAGYWVARRRRFALVVAAVGLIGLVVLSGPRWPLGFVSLALYRFLPGFSLFRDISKLFSIAGVVMSFGVALALNRALALARRSWHAFAAPAVAVAACLVVGVLMRDAFNPLRMSNFATTTLRSRDVALQRFIDTTPGNGVVMLFPTYYPPIEPTLRHPVVSAGNMALAIAPAGFMALLPQAELSIRSLFHSKIARGVLANLGTQYVVVVDDPQHVLYAPWLYDITRAQALALLNGVPWLERAGNAGGDPIFRVRGARARRPAFLASCPLAVYGDTRALDVLPAAVLANPSGIVLARQQPQGADLAVFPNVLLGPSGPLDPISSLHDPPPLAGGAAFAQAAFPATLGRHDSAMEYPLPVGSTIVARARIAKGSTLLESAIILGDRTNGYGIEYDGNGNVYLRAFRGGAIANLGRIAGPYRNDRRPHLLELTITAGGSSNEIRGSWDAIDPNGGRPVTDSSVVLTRGTWPITILTGGAGGTLFAYDVRETAPSLSAPLRELLGAPIPFDASASTSRGRLACTTKSAPFVRVNDVETASAGDVPRGLIVQSAPYDVGWRLAIVPAGVVPSGNALLDVLRLHGDFVAPARHYIVDADLNGWWTDGGRRVVAIFVPSAASEAAALVEIVALALIALVLAARRYRRR